MASVTAYANAPSVTSAELVDATIAYNAPDRSYTLTVDGRQQTFRWFDINSGLSTDTTTVYTRQSNGRTDTLTLTKPGTDGDFTYRYVGSALWRRTVPGPNESVTTFDAIVYGIESPDAAIPITGQAHYDVDLLGAYSSNGAPLVSITGQGSLQFDFATGGLATYISLNGAGGEFEGSGTLDSSGNGFSGEFTAYTSSASFTGQFDGMFFGPGAEEVGASFAGHGWGVFAGTFMGRREEPGTNPSFFEMNYPEFYATERRRVVFDKNGKDAPATVVSTDTLGLTIGYDAASWRYNFFLPEGVFATPTWPDQMGLDASTLGYAGLTAHMEELPQGWLEYGGVYYYVEAGRIVHVDGDRYIFDDFVFGMMTPGTTVLTGTAGYDTDLQGTLFSANAAPTPLMGQGLLTLDFATGAIAASGLIADSVALELVGSYQATAALASGSPEFSGQFEAEQASLTYSGDWGGALFGPNADEVGASFLAEAGDGSVMSGVILGPRDDDLIASSTPLRELAESTLLQGGAGYVRETGGSPDFTSGWIHPIDVTYDPTDGSYWIRSNEEAGNVGDDAIDAHFGVGDKDLALSTNSYDVYHTDTVDVEVLNFGAGANPVIELSYTSLAHVLQRRPDGCACETLTNEYWVAFGQQTQRDRAPPAGKASYAGIVRGGGYVQSIGQGAAASGTLTAAMDFGNSSMTAEVSLVAEDPNGIKPDVDLGVYSLAGYAGLGQFDASGASPNGENGELGIAGYMFGPNSEEIGGTWMLRIESPLPGNSDTVNLVGGFVGKQVTP